MLDKIYFNEEHKENHNIRMQSLKNALVEVFQDTTWVTKGMNDVLGRMITVSSGKILEDAYPVVKDKYTPEDLATNMSELGNVEPGMHRKIKEKAKAKLVQRRKTQKTDSLA